MAEIQPNRLSNLITKAADLFKQGKKAAGGIKEIPKTGAVAKDVKDAAKAGEKANLAPLAKDSVKFDKNAYYTAGIGDNALGGVPSPYPPLDKAAKVDKFLPSPPKEITIPEGEIDGASKYGLEGLHDKPIPKDAPPQENGLEKYGL